MRTTTQSRQLTVRVQAAVVRKPAAKAAAKKPSPNAGAAGRTLWRPTTVRQCT